MCAVIAAFFALSIRYLLHHGGSAALFSLKPIYDPATFHPGQIPTATSFAALTYIEFDGVTTLAEEVENPRRNVLIATVLDVVEGGGRGIRNGRGFYDYTDEEAKRWEERFLEFNYRIRRLTQEFSGPCGGDRKEEEG